MSINAVLCNNCGAALPSTPPPEHCAECDDLLWSTDNYIGERFHVGENIGFMSHIGFPCEGFIVQILTGGMSVLCRYKESTWRSPTYDEAHPLAEVAKTLKDLSSLLGKRSRYAPSRLTPQTVPKHEAGTASRGKKNSRKAGLGLGVAVTSASVATAATVGEASGSGERVAHASPKVAKKKPQPCPSHKLIDPSSTSINSAESIVEASYSGIPGNNNVDKDAGRAPRGKSAAQKQQQKALIQTSSISAEPTVPPTSIPSKHGDNSTSSSKPLQNSISPEKVLSAAVGPTAGAFADDALSLDGYDPSMDDLSDWIDDVRYPNQPKDGQDDSSTRVDGIKDSSSQFSTEPTNHTSMVSSSQALEKDSDSKKKPQIVSIKSQSPTDESIHCSELPDGHPSTVPPTRTLANGDIRSSLSHKIIFKRSAIKKPQVVVSEPEAARPTAAPSKMAEDTSPDLKKLAWASMRRKKRQLDPSPLTKVKDSSSVHETGVALRNGRASAAQSHHGSYQNVVSDNDDLLEDAMSQEEILFQLQRPRTWVTDFVCDRINPDTEYEHDSYPFSSKARFRCLDTSISEFSSINRLLCRIRFVEGCTPPIHSGKSRLNRIQQRKLCNAIYNNTQPHRLRADVNIALLLSAPSRSPNDSYGICSDCPVPLAYRSDLVDCGCLLLTVAALERILWACPTTISQLAAVPDLDAIAADPIAPHLLNVVNTFLSDNGIDPQGDFQEVVDINSNVEKVFPKVPRNDPNSDDWVPAFFCPLCPSLKQLGTIPMHYTQEEFNAMNPTFPLSFGHFMYAINIVYSLFDGKRMVESHNGVKGVEITETGHRTMYGSINENLTEELIQRSGMAARSRRDKSKSYTGLLCSSSSSDEAFPPDVFTDIGSGMGQVCIQVAATTGCKTFGYEIIKERFESSLTLLEHFSSVLTRAGIDIDFKSLVNFKCADFVTAPEVVCDSTVIFLNNFANWFVSDDPGKKIDYNDEFSKQLHGMRMYGQIFTLNRLISTSAWLPEKSFEAPRKAVSWIKGEEKFVRVYHYVKDSDKWLCRVCGVVTPNEQLVQCVNGHVPRAHRIGK